MNFPHNPRRWFNGRGLVQLCFTYQENKTALLNLQREKATAAATSVESYVLDLVCNLASRLCSEAKAGQTLVCSAGSRISSKRSRSVSSR